MSPPFARYSLKVAILPSHGPFIFSSSVRLSGASGSSFGFSFTPGLVIIGILERAAGTSGRVNSGWERNINAEPDRIHTATTRSGCRVVITSDQIPPPEWPHKAHGTLSTSGCPDFSA